MALRRQPALAATLTGVILTMAYAITLRRLADQWSSDEDMGHAFLVPVVIAWVIWRERSRLASLTAQPSVWGLLPFCAGICLHQLAALGAGLFVDSVSMILSIAGAVVCIAGLEYLRTWSFPLLLSLFMLPKLAFVYNAITLPLQLFASRVAAWMLTATHAAVVNREGNILDIGGRRLLVAEACSGIRYLLPLGFIALVFAYCFDSKVWMRAALLCVAIPVAIFANSLRVAFVAIFPSLETGARHTFIGAAIFVVCLIALPAAQTLFNGIHDRVRS